MDSEIVADSPLGVAINNEVQRRLETNTHWNSSGVDQAALFEFVLLLLNSKSSVDEVASSLGEILPNANQDGSLEDFARWVFQRVSGQPDQNIQNKAAAQFQQQQQQPQAEAAAHTQTFQPAQDTEMAEDGNAAGQQVPTGPRSMNDNTRRMMGQINKNLDRASDAALHRIQGSKGAGRISTHQRGAPPKGPRSMNNTRGNGNRNFRIQGMAGQQALNSGSGTLNNMSPQQQMQLLAMYEEQARMMAQFLSPDQQQSMFPSFPGQPPPVLGPNAGKSLFERVDKGSKNRRPLQNGSQTEDVSMELDSSTDAGAATQGRADPANSVCRFNLSCTRADCTFAHQSPAAPPGTTIDMEIDCSYGAACTNRKCVAKHPSPAKRLQHKSAMECKFWPNCTNANCPFQHPSSPPCRNGADCNVPACTFSHSKVVCKFNPCLNPACMFKHAEGQKRGTFEDKVWISPEDEEAQATHLSERKFHVDTGVEDEMVIPGKDTADEAAPVEGIVS